MGATHVLTQQGGLRSKQEDLSPPGDSFWWTWATGWQHFGTWWWAVGFSYVVQFALEHVPYCPGDEPKKLGPGSAERSTGRHPLLPLLFKGNTSGIFYGTARPQDNDGATWSGSKPHMPRQPERLPNLSPPKPPARPRSREWSWPTSRSSRRSPCPAARSPPPLWPLAHTLVR